MTFHLRLLRLTESTDATRGVLTNSHNGAILATLERGWRNNEKNVSRIPPGNYPIKRRQNAKLPTGDIIPSTYEIADVPNRSGILIHWGNYFYNSSGCVLVGLGYANDDEYEQIRSSREGMIEIQWLSNHFPEGSIEIVDLFQGVPSESTD